MTAPGRGRPSARQPAGDGPGGQVGQEGEGRLVDLEPAPGRLGHVAAVVPGVVEPQHPEGLDRDRARDPGHPGPPALAVEGGQVPAERVGGRLPGLQPGLGRLAPVGGDPGGGPVVERPGEGPVAPGAGQGGPVALGQVGDDVGGRPGRGGGHVAVPVGRCQPGEQPPDPAVGRLQGLDQGGGGQLDRSLPGSRAAVTPQATARMASSTAELYQATSSNTRPRTMHSSADSPNPIAPARARDRVSWSLIRLSSRAQFRRRGGAGASASVRAAATAAARSRPRARERRPMTASLRGPLPPAHRIRERLRSAHAVVVAPDKFEGSLSAGQAAAAIEAGLRGPGPTPRWCGCPLGRRRRRHPGGAGGGRVPSGCRCGPLGPTGEPGGGGHRRRDGERAFVEMAEASGLKRLPGAAGAAGGDHLGDRRPARAALDHGAREVVLGIGGSATTDGGAGMAAALGARLLDRDGADLPAGGAALLRLARIDTSGLDPRLREVRVTVACDVDNPLVGAEGAAPRAAPQKGAGPDDVLLLDSALRRYARVLADDLGLDLAATPGVGAAGGLGAGAIAFLWAELRTGIELVLELVGFDRAAAGADLVVTGEGKLDAQSLRGKAPVGVALAAAARRPGGRPGRRRRGRRPGAARGRVRGGPRPARAGARPAALHGRGRPAAGAAGRAGRAAWASLPRSRNLRRPQEKRG